MAEKTKSIDPNVLNDDGRLVLWFDDLGTGNEQFRFLSNFYESEPFTLPGLSWEKVGNIDQMTESKVLFKTGEHAFAALKTKDPDQFFGIVDAPDPQSAKTLGRTCDLRPDWEAVKLDVMAAVVRAKFSHEREEAARLLDTGDAYLCEGTFWGDTVWGVDLPTFSGRNWLGTLLMARRAELRAFEKFGATKDPSADRITYFTRTTGEHNAVFGA